MCTGVQVYRCTGVHMYLAELYSGEAQVLCVARVQAAKVPDETAAEPEGGELYSTGIAVLYWDSCTLLG